MTAPVRVPIAAPRASFKLSRRAAAVLALLLGAALVLPVETGAQPVPSPRAKPEQVQMPPSPRAKPAHEEARPGARDDAAPPAAAPIQMEDTTVDADEALCRAGLAGRAIRFTRLARIDDPGNCGATAPLEVHALAGGIALSPTAILNCRTAHAFTRWFADTVRPAARNYLGTEPVAVTIASSYICRSRNRRPGARLSEHAFANAVDISAIRFADASTYTVGAITGGDESLAQFEAAIRVGACRLFTTVLGPGADAAHRSNIHLDLRARSGGYRICQ